MNPADLGMVWMGHNSIIMDENATNPFFTQTSLPSSMGLSVMDDLSQQTQAMVNFGVSTNINFVHKIYLVDTLEVHFTVWVLL